MLAKRKCIDVEMTHIKDARHANFISRHVREKRKYEAEDEARFRKVFSCQNFKPKFHAKIQSQNGLLEAFNVIKHGSSVKIQEISEK